MSALPRRRTRVGLSAEVVHLDACAYLCVRCLQALPLLHIESVMCRDAALVTVETGLTMAGMPAPEYALPSDSCRVAVNANETRIQPDP